MAKGSSINGNGGGAKGGNASYSVKGRGEISRSKLVKEVNYKNPDTVMENMEDYLEQVYEEGEKGHMDDMMNTFKALSKLASQYMEKM